MLHKAYILLGSNRGDRKKMLANARQMIEKQAGRIIDASSIYETTPWGFSDQINFLNQVCLIETELDPYSLLNRLLGIEQIIGRTRAHQGYSARTIDLDILYFDNEVLQSDYLRIPHPRLHERKFTLIPLAELAPEHIHPVLYKSTTQLLSDCSDSSEVFLYQQKQTIEILDDETRENDI